MLQGPQGRRRVEFFEKNIVWDGGEGSFREVVKRENDTVFREEMDICVDHS